MSQRAVEQLIGRLITDSCFREKAARSLEIACFDEGYELTDAERHIVASMDFERLAQAGFFWLDDEIRRYSMDCDH